MANAVDPNSRRPVTGEANVRAFAGDGNKKKKKNKSKDSQVKDAAKGVAPPAAPPASGGRPPRAPTECKQKECKLFGKTHAFGAHEWKHEKHECGYHHNPKKTPCKPGWGETKASVPPPCTLPFEGQSNGSVATTEY